MDIKDEKEQIMSISDFEECKQPTEGILQHA